MPTAITTLQFLGAAETVTGSKYLIEHRGHRVLVDCGLFQGEKALRLRNWAAPPIDPGSVEAIVLTHAHVDHTGALPLWVRRGFKGRIVSTSATRDLAGLLLPDSAHLQEEEARYANKQRYSKHDPALPLYTAQDALRALELFETQPYGRTRELAPGIKLTFARSGHILGSALCILETDLGRRLVFSGDLGRYDAPILRDPDPLSAANVLVLESTYGDRLHEPATLPDQLSAAVNDTARRGGVLVIPAFAIGRTQELLYQLALLEAAERIPRLDVFVDSPMACDATPIYLAHAEEHDLAVKTLMEQGRSPFATARTHFVNSVEDSKRLNSLDGPAIFISASGMVTGGRILHHLRRRLPDARNTVLFVGYQAPGTRGRRLLDGEREIRMLGQNVQVRAETRQISGFSAHADWRDILRWLDGFQKPPDQTFLVHGEPPAAAALSARIAERGWQVRVARDLETVAVG